MGMNYNKPMVTVVLARPENPENIGLVARAMKNTGYRDLRVTGHRRIAPKAFKTAVHAEDVLERAGLFSTLMEAVADLDIVFAGTAKPRANFPAMTLDGALALIREMPPETKIGFLFGNERTGLTSEELRHSNFRFTIPQAGRQPSYNLAAAVLLTLYPLFVAPPSLRGPSVAKPLPRRDQEECIGRIVEILKARRFMTGANEGHITEMICDLFGRLAMSDKDRRLLLAIFHKGSVQHK
jgi:TrmH family RNA methyltransferase